MSASATTIASAERREIVTSGRAVDGEPLCATVRAPSAIDAYDTDVPDDAVGPSIDETSSDERADATSTRPGIDVDLENSDRPPLHSRIIENVDRTGMECIHPALQDLPFDQACQTLFSLFIGEIWKEGAPLVGDDASACSLFTAAR